MPADRNVVMVQIILKRIGTIPADQLQINLILNRCLEHLLQLLSCFFPQLLGACRMHIHIHQIRRHIIRADRMRLADISRDAGIRGKICLNGRFGRRRFRRYRSRRRNRRRSWRHSHFRSRRRLDCSSAAAISKMQHQKPCQNCHAEYCNRNHFPFIPSVNHTVLQAAALLYNTAEPLICMSTLLSFRCKLISEKRIQKEVL